MSNETIDALLARGRERKRRERLHRQIGALDAKRIKVAREQRFNWRGRVWRLTSTIKRLEAELVQPELPL